MLLRFNRIVKYVFAFSLDKFTVCPYNSSEHIADEYAEIFGLPDEAADGKEFISATIEPETRQKIDRLRSQTGKSIGEIIDEAFAE